jgi:hypothetical protein
LAAIAARNRPSRVPASTRISLNGSIGARAGSGGRASRDGAAEAFGAGIGRIAAEIRDMRGQHRSDEGGTGCCGSPTAMLIGGMPGFTSANSSLSRTNGERVSAVRAGWDRAFGDVHDQICGGNAPPDSPP